MSNFKLYTGDNVPVMREHLPDNSQDSCVTDGPYGIRFMGKAWDSFNIEKEGNRRDSYAVGEKRKAKGRNTTGFGLSIEAGKYDMRRDANVQFQLWFYERAKEIYRALKPGGYVVSFGSPRTFHRMVCAFEDAGFEIRDTLMWVFASGFPKSKNMPEDSEWSGWGSALKPAYEPILLARKPMDQRNILMNLRVHGTGGLNIDATRIPFVSLDDYEAGRFGSQPKLNSGRYNPGQPTEEERFRIGISANALGRWPANLLHDGSDEVVKLFPNSNGQNGSVTGTEPSSKTNNVYGQFEGRPESFPRNDSGSAARFFYCGKTTPEDRNEGLEELGLVNIHPTVKPTLVMRWLVKLVTPQGGKVFDPFVGSGSTGKAAMYELCDFIGIDEDPKNIPIAEGRIRFALKNRSGQFSIL